MYEEGTENFSIKSFIEKGKKGEYDKYNPEIK